MYESNEQFESTVAGAAWQYRWLVLFLAIAFGGLGWLYAQSNESWTASASLAIEDPRASTLFAAGYDASPERYVRSQAEIIAARPVAARAVEIAAAAEPPVTVSVDGILGGGLSVASSTDSDLLNLTYTDVSESRAIAVVNSIAAAYQQVGRETAASEFDAAIVELDSLIASLTAESSALQEELRRLWASDATRLALEDQLESALSRLIVFEPSSSSATPEELVENAASLAEIKLEIETLQSALARGDGDYEIQVNLDRQNDLRQRLVDLQLVRDQREVDAQLSTSGVVFFDRAKTASPSSVGVLALGGFLFGAIVGAAIAFPLAQRRRRFVSRGDPERVMGIPLIADVPNFFDERLGTNLPVVEAPGTASAESFRFVSASIALQRDRALVESGTATFTTVVFTSPAMSAGKTTAVANTAFAAALGGKRVLVIDADFSSQELTSLLIGTVAPRLGLADVVQGHATLADAVVGVNMEGAGSVDLLSAGAAVGGVSDLLSLPAAGSLFLRLSEHYDLVLVDGPPVLTVAYSTTLVRLAERVMVVLAHGQDFHSALDLRHQLDIIGIPVLGYVYNFAPLRAEMAVAGGSAADWRNSSGAGQQSEVSGADL
jgi:Mrp family chromosome partitioning ATPase/capsular polysaccharide biosynthesis protein